MKKKMIVFDMDGTLADTRPVVIEALNEFAPSFNYDRLDEEDVRHLRHSRSIAFLKVLGIPLWRAPFLIKKVQKRLGERIEEMELVSGMSDLLLAIKSHDTLLGVGTSNTKENADLFFNKFKGKYFDFRRTGIIPFTKHRALKKLARKYNIKPECIYYVGDETRDVLAAKKAGTKVIAVTWGFNDREILETLKPDFVADSPAEILTFLEEKEWKLCT
jgi:phosphoglycolate phosphatase-like HAD superfamily hydrolase